MSDLAPTPTTDPRGELIGRLKSKLKEYAVRIKALETERDTAVGEAATAAKKAERAAADYNAEPLKVEVDRLKATLRERDHRAVFDRLAAERGADKDAIDLIYQQSGYEPKGDAADEKAVATLLDEMKAKPGISRLFGEAPAPEPEKRPAPAKGQGSRVGEGDRIKATSAQLRDHTWAWQHRNALRESRVDLVD